MKTQSKPGKIFDQKEVSKFNKPQFQKYKLSSLFSESKQSKAQKSNNKNLANNTYNHINPVDVLKKKEVSAFNRRIKEFHNIDNFKENDFCSYAVLEKEFKSMNVGFMTERSNANGNGNGAQKLRKYRNLSALEAQNSLDYNYDGSMTARQNLVESLKSNIFNEEGKVYPVKSQKQNNKSRNNNLSLTDTKKNFNRNTDLRHVAGDSNHWLNTNTELLYYRLYEKTNHETFYSNVKNKTLASKLDSKEVVDNYGSLTERNISNYRSNLEQIEINNQIANNLKQKLVSDTKTKKTMDSISSLQDKNSYHKNILNSEKIPDTESFEIKDAKKVDATLLKKIFLEKGIHLFDLKVNENLNDHKLDTLTFKVRKNEKKKKKAFQAVIDNLKTTNNIHILKSAERKKLGKPLSITFPADIRWDDIKLEKMSNSKEKVKPEPKVKLKPEEKFSSKDRLPYDTKYKNFLLSKKQELESMSKKVTTVSSKVQKK